MKSWDKNVVGVALGRPKSSHHSGLVLYLAHRFLLVIPGSRQSNLAVIPGLTRDPLILVNSYRVPITFIETMGFRVEPGMTVNEI